MTIEFERISLERDLAKGPAKGFLVRKGEGTSTGDEKGRRPPLKRRTKHPRRH